MNEPRARPISVAITAIGGQGGGVLAEWVRHVAEANGYLVQTTSVPGVAQRTGATVYCVELFPAATAQEADAIPVLSLMPVPGDVDVCVAAELMEAGRAIQRGYVTPDRTVLITSTHRDFAIEEKTALGDGRLDGDAVLAAAEIAAQRVIGFDMDALARRNGSVVSAVLFGVLAGSAALPFPREAFEEAIRASGKGVEASLAAFAAGFERAAADTPAEAVPDTAAPDAAEAIDTLFRERISEELPDAVHETAAVGVARLVDYQDTDYAADYLDRLVAVVTFDSAARGHRLTTELARHLAVWMTFEDTFRVADLKSRPERLERIRAEVGAAPDQLLRVTEYLHPRVEEVCDSLPADWGRRVLASPWLRGLVDRLFGGGRKVATHTVFGFLQLQLLAQGRRWRRRSLRYAREQEQITAWLERIAPYAERDYELAVELISCQELRKGYGDTQARGVAAFDRVCLHADTVLGQADAALQVAKLRDAALADEDGERLGEVLVTLERRPKPATA